MGGKSELVSMTLWYGYIIYQRPSTGGGLGITHTSAYFPFLSNIFLNCLTNAPPSLSSSSILLGQSLRPVLISICSAYAAIEPLMFCSRSMSSPGGASRHWHVGDGHCSSTGTGGGVKGRSIREA